MITPPSVILTVKQITMWYKRHECGLRMAVFFSAATAAGAFGGLLARGISGMNGVGGKSAWVSFCYPHMTSAEQKLMMAAVLVVDLYS